MKILMQTRADHKKEFINLIGKTAYRHDTWTVFTDFLLMTATAISNSIDKRQFNPREKAYLDTVKKYNKEEMELFPQMYAELVLTLQEYADERCPRDVLGEVFHDLEFHNKWKGQFFSPEPICKLMGKFLIDNRDSEVEKYGYVTLNEPCSGGGAMIFGFATVFAERKFNYCKQMFIEASDVDIKCVYMTYIQLSLYGIPAVVYHRNTLSMETWSAWYTPIYIIDGWSRRRQISEKRRTETAEVMEMLEA